MKLKRILSSVLMVVLLFGTIIGAYPFAASAAYSTESATSGLSATANLTVSELEKHLADYIAVDYDSAEEFLNADIEAGFLYSVNSANNYYTLYVNKYTGMIFYKNNVTGQILTSNPVNPGYNNAVVESNDREMLMSQISVNFEVTATGKPDTYTSYQWAASRNQISVSPISGGLRVAYTLGDTTTRFLLPGAMKAESFFDYIVEPLYNQFYEKLTELIGDKYDEEKLDFFLNDTYTHYVDGCINLSSNKTKNKGLLTYFNDMLKLVEKDYDEHSSEYNAIYDIQSDTIMLTRAYSIRNPLQYEEGDKKLEEMYEQYPITKEGIAIYVYTGNTLAEVRRQLSGIIKKRLPDFSYEIMYDEEKECGYVEKIEQKPVFRCALEYSFNSDGSLSVRLPASSITFDESVYTLKAITPLQFFGCADARDPGYIFYPDGSGTVIRFSDFYDETNDKKTALTNHLSTYGIDYCYSDISKITGNGGNRQQIVMPVYGVVTEVNANETTKDIYGLDRVNNGFFAILEEGDALAIMEFNSGGRSYVYGGAYASFEPYPNDTFNLSDTISVGGNTKYTMVSESKYTGSYVTRYVMLTDETIGESVYGKDGYYASSYVGMASYYRNFLKANGVLEALEIVNEDLPLYIELLGSMQILAKVLSFPVNKSIPLTTFEDVATIYNDLLTAKEKIEKAAADNAALAAAETDEVLKANYEALANEYSELAKSVENIANVNFRLTGFTNGGLKSTYPVKVRWERVCGGRRGFIDLLETAELTSAEAGKNFGVYPEFDFMYIRNTAMFDGIGSRGNVSKMVDNRYASYQTYNPILQTYESVFDLVISSDALDKNYSKFNKKFSKTEADKISVSTLGSDINSNFDKKNPINRDQAREDIVDLLDRMKNQDGYDIMTDVGNIYAVKYATHILNMPTDSSHLRFASYAVPFVGLVLHSYVNYTGTPLNYAGNLDYEILKSIENGAAPYYILCYQNSAFLKDDQELNDYYGISYDYWYENVLTTYHEINSQIGDLQNYEIVDHKVVISERVIEQSEMDRNYVLLKAEILDILDKTISDSVDEAFRTLAANPDGYVKRVKIVVEKDKLMAQFAEILNVSADELNLSAFSGEVDSLIKSYTDMYCGDDANGNSFVATVSEIEYKSKYSYITDSGAFDKDYVKTEYTIDNGNVAIVTYKNGDSEVKFILNYNNYSVNVRLDANTVYTVGKCDYIRIG